MWVRLDAALVKALATSPYWKAARNLRSQHHGRTALEIAMLAPATARSATTPAWRIPGGAPHATTPPPAPTPPPATTATPTDGGRGGEGGEGGCSELPGESGGRATRYARVSALAHSARALREVIMPGDQTADASAAPHVGTASPAGAATETGPETEEPGTETDTPTRASSPNPFLAAKRAAATLLEAHQRRACCDRSSSLPLATGRGLMSCW